MAGFSYRELAQLNRGSPDVKKGLNSGGKSTKRLVGVLYGHNGGGKVYDYLADENARVGDIVTPEVTHAKGAHPTYNTLARIVRTQDSQGAAAQNTEGNLSSQGIQLKTIGQTDQRSLPGFQAEKAKNPNFTAKQWKAESDTHYREQKNRILGLNPKQDNTEAAKRILGG